MVLKDFIKDVLEQLEDLKNVQEKKNYLVQELEFELTLTQSDSGKIGVSLLGLGADMNASNQNAHRVKVKLVPRSSRRNIPRQV